MPSGSLFQSTTYRVACACSLALVAFVIARAPLWNPLMAGARVQLASGDVALVPTVWQCRDSPLVCATTVAGEELTARMGPFGEQPLRCTATFRGHAVACTPRLWYAPRLKHFVEIGDLPGVTFRTAMLERPWRLLDLGLLGETGPLYGWAGLVCAFLIALAAGALIRRGGIWWIARVAISMLTFVGLSGVWFMQCFLLGYID